MFGKEIHKMQNWYVIRQISLISGFLVLFTCACSSPTSSETFKDDYDVVNHNQLMTGYTQGTTYTIITGEDSLFVTKNEVEQLLAQFDTSLSTYISKSIVTKFNRSPIGTNSYTDNNNFFQQCLEESIEVYKMTEGAFNPSVYPLVAGWGFLKDPKIEMDQHVVDSLLQLTGFEEGVDFSYTRLTNEQFSLIKKKNNLRFDFNAIAQGLSVDEVAKLMEKKGHVNYFVEIGGEVKVKGRNREGHFWRIGVDAPKESNDGREQVRDITNVVNLRYGAVATSGNYRKFYEKDGMKYSHTINPKTGYPVQHTLLSATVWSDKCSKADAYATAFMVMGLDETKNFLDTHPELKLEVLLIFSNEKGRMEKFFTPGMKKFLD